MFNYDFFYASFYYEEVFRCLSISGYVIKTMFHYCFDLILGNLPYFDQSVAYGSQFRLGLGVVREKKKEEGRRRKWQKAKLIQKKEYERRKR
jgi:hypothetical protein